MGGARRVGGMERNRGESMNGANPSFTGQHTAPYTLHPAVSNALAPRSLSSLSLVGATAPAPAINAPHVPERLQLLRTLDGVVALIRTGCGDSCRSSARSKHVCLEIDGRAGRVYWRAERFDGQAGRRHEGKRG